jgi:hypothetical protein
MPTKRRRRSPHVASIPPGALEAWRAGDRDGLHRAYRLAADDITPFDGYLFGGTRALEIYETLSAICPPGEHRSEANAD